MWDQIHCCMISVHFEGCKEPCADNLHPCLLLCVLKMLLRIHRMQGKKQLMTTLLLLASRHQFNSAWLEVVREQLQCVSMHVWSADCRLSAAQAAKMVENFTCLMYSSSFISTCTTAHTHICHMYIYIYIHTYTHTMPYHPMPYTAHISWAIIARPTLITLILWAFDLGLDPGQRNNVTLCDA